MPETVLFISYSSHSTPNNKLHHERLSCGLLKIYFVHHNLYSGILPDHLLCLCALVFLFFSSPNSWPTPAFHPDLASVTWLVPCTTKFICQPHWTSRGLMRDWLLVVLLQAHEPPLPSRKALFFTVSWGLWDDRLFMFTCPCDRKIRPFRLIFGGQSLPEGLTEWFLYQLVSILNK